MKDLAYLNAGAARQQEVGGRIDQASVAHDVDADFSGKIDLGDLSILDADWGKSLHNGDQDFQGSADLSWNELDQQGTTGDAAWDNQAFKDQNAVEASTDFVESLENPTAVGVIDADGNSNQTDNDIAGTEFQN